MKRVIISSLIIAMVLSLGITFADKPQDDEGDYMGNGAPSGKHETINIIGVNPKKDDWSGGGQGSVIFVDRTGKTTFYVSGGQNFQIVDHDGTDGYVGTNVPGTTAVPDDPDTPEDETVIGDPGGAGLIFPYNAGLSPTWRVQIWIRLLGPKGSEVNFKSYYYDTLGNTYVFYDEFDLDKHNPPTKFSEQTGKLLADGYENMLWEMDEKTKFRICQMRIFLLD